MKNRPQPRMANSVEIALKIPRPILARLDLLRDGFKELMRERGERPDLTTNDLIIRILENYLEDLDKPEGDEGAENTQPGGQEAVRGEDDQEAGH